MRQEDFYRWLDKYLVRMPIEEQLQELDDFRFYSWVQNYKRTKILDKYEKCPNCGKFSAKAQVKSETVKESRTYGVDESQNDFKSDYHVYEFLYLVTYHTCPFCGEKYEVKAKCLEKIREI